ncbi:putative signal peptide protein [Puccinia sorghi]|uniref:Putative signal peptide protein n=1 Tax=Puccinia sorghi TaxID=27349 RepID=A0A0L6UFW0_9BASI|nr:putative signal peptide protein [Puccinia sorghi]
MLVLLLSLLCYYQLSLSTLQKKTCFKFLKLKCRKSHEASVVTSTFLQELFNQALMYSHCADCTVTVPKHLTRTIFGTCMASAIAEGFP